MSHTFASAAVWASGVCASLYFVTLRRQGNEHLMKRLYLQATLKSCTD
jgi:hypothetical protein